MLSSDSRLDCTHAVQVTCILLSERERHLYCVESERGLEKNLFRNDLLRHCQSTGIEWSEHGQIPVGGGTVDVI